MSQYTIKDLAQLRSIIGEKIPGLEDKNLRAIDDFASAFIAKVPFIVISTADQHGRMDASPKGDAPGFVKVVDQQTLLIPDRPGNKLAYGHENILANPHIGVLFFIPNTSETLRINGRAELTCDPDILAQLAARDKPATLAIRVFVEECFFHCGKSMLRSNLWQPETWQEKHKVSFGQMYAARNKTDQSVVAAVDEMIAADYKNNL
ncbi:MAG: pyridoxamine 5'-phosphate oxidase family protein [Pseudomonadales bacterium]|nr:pyridoxamine 5'-phosphate oxidase family protein [Pseudomonadales bacterium]